MVSPSGCARRAPQTAAFAVFEPWPHDEVMERAPHERDSHERDLHDQHLAEPVVQGCAGAAAADREVRARSEHDGDDTIASRERRRNAWRRSSGAPLQRRPAITLSRRSSDAAGCAPSPQPRAATTSRDRPRHARTDRPPTNKCQDERRHLEHDPIQQPRQEDEREHEGKTSAIVTNASPNRVVAIGERSP